MELDEESGFPTDTPDCPRYHKPIQPTGSGVADSYAYDRWRCGNCEETLERNF